MSMRIEDIVEEALTLPDEERVLLADRLVESLNPAEDDCIRELWVKEAQGRLQELRSGIVKGISGNEAMSELRQKYFG
ncbi:MAG: addiction module protein [Chthoniobacterales bacterium]